MNARWLKARWTLGWALVKHVLLQPFVRRDPARWVRRIAQESLGPTPAEGWNLFAASSRCMGCGLCDAVVPAGMQPSAWMQGAIREPADAPLALAKARQLRAWAQDIERVCPAQVKVEAVARLIEEHHRALHAAPFSRQ